MDLAKDDATRAALSEAAAQRKPVPADIADLLAKVSVSATAIGSQLVSSGATGVADLPRLFEEKPELVNSLSDKDRNKLLMLAGRFRASNNSASASVTPDEAVIVIKHSLTALLDGAPLQAQRVAAKSLYEAVSSSPVARTLLYESDKLRPLWNLANAPPEDMDWVVRLAVQRSVEVLTRSNVSVKYWLAGMLDEHDSLATRGTFFYDAGRVVDFFSPAAFASRAQPPLRGTRETITVDTAEPDLQVLIGEVRAAIERLGGQATLRQRITRCAMWVADRMGKTGTSDESSLCDKCKEHIAELVKDGDPVRAVSITKIRKGVCRHRSVLFKVLCDALLPEANCRLVRGNYGGPDGAHVWNVVVLEESTAGSAGTRSTYFLVDVMHDAKQLYPEGCTKAEEYKSTAGFTIGASSVDGIIRVMPTKESDWEYKSPALGRGRFGEVWRCTLKPALVPSGAPSEVAVKKILLRQENQIDAERDELHANAKREAAIAMACNSPFVVRVHGLVVGQDYLFIVMDYAPGGTFETAFEKMPNSGRPRDEFILRFAAELAAGLAYLHSRRITHWDIKPVNLLRSASGGVVITDFGLSRMFDAGALSANMSGGGGTPPYAAPEVRRRLQGGTGGAPYDTRISRRLDAWSYGVCVARALLGGRIHPSAALCVDNDGRPFKCGDVEAAEKKATPAVRRLFDLYRSCTVTKPTDRPDMAEVAQSLERHILDVLLTN
jgi:hypothetical protein